MIGGVDIKISTRSGPAALDASVRVIRSFWPRAVFENAETGEYYNRFDEIPFGCLGEIFVYKDKAARDLWEADGAVPEAANLMIHLIAENHAPPGESALFIVMDDDATKEMQCVLGALRSILGAEDVRSAA